MTTNLTMDWTIENDDEQDVGASAQTTTVTGEDIKNAFVDLDVAELTDEEISDTLFNFVGDDFANRMSPVVDDAVMTRYVAQARAILGAPAKAA